MNLESKEMSSQENQFRFLKKNPSHLGTTKVKKKREQHSADKPAVVHDIAQVARSSLPELIQSQIVYYYS